jgi:hypothetical protein
LPFFNAMLRKRKFRKGGEKKGAVGKENEGI